MKPDTAIKIENLSKQYRLGLVGTGTLSHDLKRWWTMNIRGKEDPFLKIGDVNDRAHKGTSDYVWALKDINLEIEQGDVVGIIGKNGAGKSTLLKMLSRVTRPTTGSISYKGRIAALLEVGTGFHSEMTGRENIYMNGSIMGMTRTEISRKLDEIVDFAGIERYIDTPVKRYSSGMTVRLGFSVAAHLEPEILVVDEVLAVGDAEFQKKAIGKMHDVSKGAGRTVLFVSHNMVAVKSLCKSGVLLENGQIARTGEMNIVIEDYLRLHALNSAATINKTVTGVSLIDIHCSNNGVNGNFDIDKELIFTITLENQTEEKQINVNIFFNAPEGGNIFATTSKAEKIAKGTHKYQCQIPANILNDITYTIDVMVVLNSTQVIIYEKNILTIQGIEPIRETGWMGKFPGLIRPANFVWNRS